MNVRALIIVIITFAVTALFSSAAFAQGAQVIVTPKASYRIVYDDNVNNTKDGDIEHQLRPALQVDINTERSKNRLEAGLTVHRYGDKDNLDRTEQEYTLSSRNELHERVRLNLTASYEDDYTISKIAEELAETTRKTARRRLTVSPRLEFVVTEKNLLGLTYTFSSTDYDRADYVDYDYHGLSADWTYIWTERFRLRASTGLSWYDNQYNDGDGSYSDVTFMTGFEYDLNEIWTWSLMGGYLQSKSTVDRPTLDIEEDGDGYVGTTQLAWDYPRSDGYVEYSRDNTVGLSGETLTRDRFRLRELYLLTERTRLRFDVSVTLTESDGSINERDSAYYSLRPGIEYDLDENWTWEAGYSYEYSEDKINDSNYDRNKFYMGIRWDLPMEM